MQTKVIAKFAQAAFNQSFLFLLIVLFHNSLYTYQNLFISSKIIEAECLAHQILEQCKIPRTNDAFETIKQASYEQQDTILSYLLRTFMDPHDRSSYSASLFIMIHCDKILNHHIDLKRILEKHIQKIPDLDTFQQEFKRLYNQKALPPKVHTTIQSQYLYWKGIIFWNGKEIFKEKLK
jgi:hypothetical protein